MVRCLQNPEDEHSQRHADGHSAEPVERWRVLLERFRYGQRQQEECQAAGAQHAARKNIDEVDAALRPLPGIPQSRLDRYIMVGSCGCFWS